MKLWKFKSLKNDGLLHALQMLSTKQIFMANCSVVNDTKEGEWFDCSSPPKNMSAELSRTICERNVRLKEMVGGMRFCSFSRDESLKNPLMWGHYSGGGNGVAICYELSQADIELNQLDVCEVWYKGMPKLTHKDVEDIVENGLCLLSKGVLRSKDPCWHYENEVRLVSKNFMRYPFITLEPKAIVVGSVKNSPEWQVFSSLSNQFHIPFAFLTNGKNGKSGLDILSQESYFDYLCDS